MRLDHLLSKEKVRVPERCLWTLVFLELLGRETLDRVSCCLILKVLGKRTFKMKGSESGRAAVLDMGV